METWLCLVSWHEDWLAGFFPSTHSADRVEYTSMKLYVSKIGATVLHAAVRGMCTSNQNREEPSDSKNRTPALLSDPTGRHFYILQRELSVGK